MSPSCPMSPSRPVPPPTTKSYTVGVLTSLSCRFNWHLPSGPLANLNPYNCTHVCTRACTMYYVHVHVHQYSEAFIHHCQWHTVLYCYCCLFEIQGLHTYLSIKPTTTCTCTWYSLYTYTCTWYSFCTWYSVYMYMIQFTHTCTVCTTCTI